MFRLDDNMANDFVYDIAMAAEVLAVWQKRSLNILNCSKLYSFALTVIVL